MSLRRAALQRRTELRRQTPMPRARSARAERVKRTIARDTGPSRSTRLLVAGRAAYSCERCGLVLGGADAGWVGVHSFHHRQPRGAGGTARVDVNGPANLLLLCGTGVTGCHGWVEAHREVAYEHGWLVRSGFVPGVIPVRFALGEIYLTDDGHYLEAS